MFNTHREKHGQNLRLKYLIPSARIEKYFLKTAHGAKSSYKQFKACVSLTRYITAYDCMSNIVYFKNIMLNAGYNIFDVPISEALCVTKI